MIIMDIMKPLIFFSIFMNYTPIYAKIKAWKMNFTVSNDKTVPWRAYLERLLKPYIENTIAVVNKEIFPDNPINSPNR